jgi:membrane protein YqaA with SNARE-associated domain
MQGFVQHLFRLAFHADAFGLLVVGILDSSVLILPLGNDFLLMGLSARHPHRVWLYVLMATAGSAVGVSLTMWLGKAGRESLDQSKGGKRRRYVEKQIKKRIGWALFLASSMPPPFPFTAVVVIAGALETRWSKVLPLVATGRLVRFGIEAALAVQNGRWILSLARSAALRDVIIGMIVIAVCGGAYSIYKWMRR